MVFITGGAFSLSAHEFLESVSNERIEKPFDASTLRALVRRFVPNPGGRAPVEHRSRASQAP